MATRTVTPDWDDVKKYCEEQIMALRKQNDEDMNVVETARLRGEIEFAKKVLGLDKVEIKIEVSKNRDIY